MRKTIPALILLAALLLTTACGGESDTTTAPKGNTTAPKQTTKDAAVKDDDQTEPSTPSDPTDPATEPGDDDDDDDDLFTNDDVEIFIVKGSPEVDGEKDEIWNNAQTVLLENPIKDNPSPDTQVKASAMWDENAIYFLFEITDSSIFQGGSVGDYNNDGIYLYIAESMDIYATSADNYGYGAYQFALISPELEMLPRRNEDGNDLKAKTAYNQTENGMIIEFSYSFTTGELTDGAFITVDYQYNDCDEAATRLGALNFNSSRSDGDWNTMNLAIARLVETIPEA